MPAPGDQGPSQQDLYAQIQQYDADNGISPNEIVNGGTTDGSSTDGSSTDGLTDRGFGTDAGSTTTTTQGGRIASVPNVTGEDAATATSQLRAAGFRVSRHAASGRFATGTVVSQSPGGGSLAAVGSTVTIGVVGG